MGLPTVADVHVNAPLTNLSIGYLQNPLDFVADQVFPNVPVAKKTDAYYTINRGDYNRDQARLRAPATESAGVGYKLDANSTYDCRVYAVHHDIPNQVLDNADAVLNLDQQAVDLLMHQLLIRRENVWASTYFKTGVWQTEVTGVTGAPSSGQFKRWDVSGSTPIADIRARKTAIKKLTGFTPNTLVLSQEVFDKLVDNADFIDRVKAGQTPNGPAKNNEMVIAEILGLDRVLVASAINNTAHEGATEASAFILGKHALLAYSAKAPGIMTPSAGYTFSWQYAGRGSIGQSMDKFYMQELKATRVEGEIAFDCKLVDSYLGAFFLNAIS